MRLPGAGTQWHRHPASNRSQLRGQLRMTGSPASAFPFHPVWGTVACTRTLDGSASGQQARNRRLDSGARLEAGSVGSRPIGGDGSPRFWPAGLAAELSPPLHQGDERTTVEAPDPSIVGRDDHHAERQHPDAENRQKGKDTAENEHDAKPEAREAAAGQIDAATSEFDACQETSLTCPVPKMVCQSGVRKAKLCNPCDVRCRNPWQAPVCSVIAPAPNG